MSLNKTLKGDVLIVKLNEERTTFKEYEPFKTLVQSEIDNGIKKLIIDMSTCTFIDSTILGLMINFLKQLEGNVKLVHVNADVQMVLDITRTSTLFHSYSSVEEALNSI